MSFSFFLHVYSSFISSLYLVQSAGTAEYTDSISAEGKTALTSVQSDREARVMMELWGMRNTLSLPLLPGPL